MKRHRAIIAVLLAASISVAPLGSFAESYEPKQYPGEKEYKQKYKNINFIDMDNHWSQEAVMTIGSLGMIKGVAEGKYSPNSTLTKEDSLLLIIRLLGLEDEAQREAMALSKAKDTAGYNVLDPYHYTIKGTISVAIDRGIIDESELLNIIPITSYTKSLIENDVESELENYKSLGLTATQLKNVREDLTEKYSRNYTWKTPANRETVAYWLGRALDISGTDGSSIQAVYTFDDWTGIKESYIPFIESVLQKGYIRGDERNRFNPKESLTRAEMAQIIYNSHEENLKQRGYEIKSGLVTDVKFEQTTEKSRNVKRRHIEVTDEDNEVVEFYSQAGEDGSPSLDRGIITYIDKKLSDHQVLKKSQEIKYYINPNGEVALVKDNESESESITGEIKGVYENSLLIKSDGGKTYRLEIGEKLDLRINGSQSEKSNLMNEMKGIFQIVSGKVRRADLEVEEGGAGGSGNISVGDYFETGIAVSADNDSLTVIRDGKPELQTYDTKKHNIPVYRDDKKIEVSEVSAGESVAVYYSDLKGTVAKIIIKTHRTRSLENIYKGRISHYNRNRNEIRLADISRIDGTSSWEKLRNEETIPLSERADLYVTDEFGTTDMLISKDSFEDYMAYSEQKSKFIENALKRENEIYAYTEKINGKEEIMRIALKKAGEYKYTGKVKSITNGLISISSNQNIYYDNSTIVIRSGNLVTTRSIDEGDTVTVYTHDGRNTAAVVIVEGKAPENMLSPYRAFTGELTDVNVTDQTIEIKESILDKEPQKKTWSLSKDSKIELIPEKRMISQEEFYTNYYNSFKKSHVKAVADDSGEIVGMQIYEEEEVTPDLKDYRTAVVKSKDLNNGTITLASVRTHGAGGWSGEISDMTFDFSDAIAVKSGKSVTIDRVLDGSRVEVITDINKGHILIVK